MSQSQSPPRIYAFWAGENSIPQSRLKSLRALREVSECEIELVTVGNLDEYILPEHPLHAAYEYLSAVHKADYLRTYFMHFYGGGYSDVKATTGSWLAAFAELEGSDAWVNGYREVEGGVANTALAGEWASLIGNGCFICKPRTPLTTQWYGELLKLMDSKLNELRLHPAKSLRDVKGSGTGYPMGWGEMLGDIFARACYGYRDRLLRTVPYPYIVYRNEAGEWELIFPQKD
jgi:hypothetical protein